MSGSTKSATFLPSIIYGAISYFQSLFSSKNCYSKGNENTPAPPYCYSMVLKVGLFYLYCIYGMNAGLYISSLLIGLEI